MIQCAHCGTELPAGTQVCTRCGSQQPTLAASEQPTVIGTPLGMFQGPPEAQGSQPPPFNQPPAGFGQHPSAFGSPPPPGAWQGPPVQSPAAPVPPKRSKLPLIIGGVSGVLLLCCIGAFAVTILLTRLGSSAGTMKFGTDYSQTNNSFAIVGEKETFGVGEQIAFVANLSERAKASGLDLIMVRVNADGTEEELFNAEVAISDPDTNRVAYKNPVLLALTGDQQGTYKLRLSRDGTVLAEGTFTYQ